MCQNSQNKSFFRVRILPRCYVIFCKIESMERQKIITFKKKFIKKQLFVEEICHFQEQKSVAFPLKSETFPKENQWKSVFGFFNFHWFPFGNVPGLGANFTYFCSWKWYFSLINKSFLIHFFKVIFLTLRQSYLAESHVIARKHPNSEKRLILGVLTLFVEGHCSSIANLHYCEIL